MKAFNLSRNIQNKIKELSSLIDAFSEETGKTLMVEEPDLTYSRALSIMNNDMENFAKSVKMKNSSSVIKFQVGETYRFKYVHEYGPASEYLECKVLQRTGKSIICSTDNYKWKKIELGVQVFMRDDVDYGYEYVNTLIDNDEYRIKGKATDKI